MLKVISRVNSPVYYPIMPQVDRLEPGIFGQFYTVGQEVMLGISDGSAPAGILDDHISGQFNTTKPADKAVIHMAGGSIFATDQYELNFKYEANCRLYVNKGGFLTSRNTGGPCVGFCIVPPSAKNAHLEFFYSIESHGKSITDIIADDVLESVGKPEDAVGHYSSVSEEEQRETAKIMAEEIAEQEIYLKNKIETIEGMISDARNYAIRMENEQYWIKKKLGEKTVQQSSWIPGDLIRIKNELGWISQNLAKGQKQNNSDNKEEHREMAGVGPRDDSKDVFKASESVLYKRIMDDLDCRRAIKQIKKIAVELPDVDFPTAFEHEGQVQDLSNLFPYGGLYEASTPEIEFEPETIAHDPIIIECESLEEYVEQCKKYAALAEDIVNADDPKRLTIGTAFGAVDMEDTLVNLRIRDIKVIDSNIAMGNLIRDKKEFIQYLKDTIPIEPSMKEYLERFYAENGYELIAKTGKDLEPEPEMKDISQYFTPVTLESCREDLKRTLEELELKAEEKAEVETEDVSWKMAAGALVVAGIVGAIASGNTESNLSHTMEQAVEQEAYKL